MRAKFSLANTILIASPTQTLLFLHRQLTSKQKMNRTLCVTWPASLFSFLTVQFLMLSAELFFSFSGSNSPKLFTEIQWCDFALWMNDVFLKLTVSSMPLLGVRAKSNQCSVHCLSQSLTWTALLLVVLVPSASWWGLYVVLMSTEGASCLPLPHPFDCILWP